MIKKLIIIVKILILLMLLCTVNVFADTTSDENIIKLKGLSLISNNDTITIGENLTNIFNVELDGNNFVTMYARNVNDDNQLIHITLINGGVMHVRDMLATVPLTNGMYYISDIFVNPGESNYVRYSKDSSIEGALPLEFDLKFNLIGEKPPVELTELSLIGGDNKIEFGEDLIKEFYVGINSSENIELITMYAKNRKDVNQIVHITLTSDAMHVRDVVTKAPLTNGTYYISDVFINPNLPDSSSYVRYSKDKSLEGIIPLDFYLEFELEIIKENEDIKNNDEIQENIEKNDEIVENEIIKDTNEILEDENINGMNIDKNTILDSEFPNAPEGVKELTINSRIIDIVVIAVLMICIVILFIVEILPKIRKKK